MEGRTRDHLKVALVYGGNSNEREVSLMSAAAVRRALSDLGFEIADIDPARIEDLEKLVTEDYDLAFLTVHGKHGEDGTLQGLLELLGIPYTGSGVWSSATAIDKAKTKVRYRSAGIPTPKSQTLSPAGLTASDLLDTGTRLPCVVKEIDGGSSVGVTIARTEGELSAALAKASKSRLLGYPNLHDDRTPLWSVQECPGRTSSLTMTAYSGRSKQTQFRE